MDVERKHGCTRLPLLGTCLSLGLLVACATRSPAAPPPAPDLGLFQGTWEGEGEAGTVSMTVAGDSLWFYGRPDFQYDTSFTLVPGADPPELHATILESPRTSDSVGERVVAIYAFRDGVLDIAVVDRPDGEPASFDHALSRYRFVRVPAGD